MTLFIRNDNIKIIWDVVLMCPLFNESFTTEQSKKEWFNQRISKVEKQLGKNISIGDLRSINRDTIKLIMSDLKEHYLSVSTDIASRPKPIIIGSDTDTPYMRRQNEYDKMKSVYVPTQIDFRSGEVDQPITNMSELIEQHVNERRKTLDVPSAFLSNDTNNISWTSSEITTPDSIVNNWRNGNNISVDKKVVWTTPIVEQEIIIPSIQTTSQTQTEPMEDLSLKIDTILQELSFITNYLKCSTSKTTVFGDETLNVKTEPTHLMLSNFTTSNKRERSVSF
jgi:hypothetical protein